MIIALLILVPISVAVAWAFLRLSPAHADRKALLRFNVIAITLSLVLCVVWAVRTYLVMSPTADLAWWPVISALGALFIIPVVLVLAAIVRSFVVFRRRAEGSGS